MQWRKGFIMSTINRRDFFSKSALSLTAASALAALPKRSLAANEKINVGLVGCGGMGRGDLDTFFANPEIECPVICDIDDKQIAECLRLVEGRRGNTPETVKDFRRVIDRKDIDIVLVATPDHWHALPTIYACQAGKDVYVEKPLGQSVQEGRAMLDAMRNNRRVVQMGTQWRSGEHYRAAASYVRSGKLGRIRMVRAWAYLDWLGGIGNPPDSDPPPGVDYDMWLGPAPKRPFNPNRFHFNFRWFWDYAGGLMTDWGVHLLNICLWAMGPEPPVRVMSSGGKYALDDNSETPDTQFALYEFPEYALIWEHQIQGGIGPNGKPHGMLFSGTDATLTIDADGWRVQPEPKKVKVKAEEHPAGPDARPAHVRNFLDCVKTRKDPVENLDIAHFVSSIAHLGNLALRSNSEIHWDAEKEIVKDNPAANRLVRASYRDPWELPLS
jgi:predicted dehydrogenase